MNVAAFDLSLTETGYAIWSYDGLLCGTLVPPKEAKRGMPRLQWIRQAVFARAWGKDIVLIEGYSYGSKGRAVINIGELGGVVRLMLYERQLTYLEVPPTVVKKLATGKGNASKDLVLVEAVKRLGYAGANNNEADALWLLQLAQQHYELPHRVSLPQTHLEALKTISWPTPHDASQETLPLPTDPE